MSDAAADARSRKVAIRAAAELAYTSYGIGLTDEQAEARRALSYSARGAIDHLYSAVTRLREENAELRRSAEMACVDPRPDCGCSGCTFADEVMTASCTWCARPACIGDHGECVAAIRAGEERNDV